MHESSAQPAGTPQRIVDAPLAPSVTVIVLNWNSWRSTLVCVRDLMKLDYLATKLLIVDNDSHDESVDELRRAIPDIEILQTGANLGYAGGNNAGIRRALEGVAEYVLVINPDVSLQPTALSTMMAHCLASPHLAAVCPVIRWKNDPSKVWFGGGTVSWSRATAKHRYVAPPHDGLYPSHWASGCCLLLSTDALKQVGLFDADLFLYWEEVDLCQRLLQSKYSVAVDSDAVAYHDVSSSIGLDSARGWYYFVRNAFVFFTRYAPRHRVPRWWVAAVLYVRFGLLGVPWALISRDGTAAARLLGCLDYARGRTGPSARYNG